jgi:hypothetical protein
MNDTTESVHKRPEPPVKQLEDVPEEEWGYWTAQAYAGCGVIFALMLAMFLPLTLSTFMDDTAGKVIGFGIAGSIALISIAIISRLTYRDRQKRRDALLAKLGAGGGGLGAGGGSEADNG